MSDRLIRLFALLKDLYGRKVIHVGSVYVLGALLVIANAEAIIDLIGWPALARPLLGAIAAGFPIALYLAWAYDLTPSGIVRDQGANPSPWLKVLVTFTTILLAIVGFRLPPLPPPDPDDDATPGLPVVAILPFESLGDRERAEFFSTGLRDQLENALTSAAGNSFTMRSNGFVDAFAGLRADSIARALGGVSFFIDASVTHLPDSITVIVDLVDGTGAIKESRRISTLADGPPHGLIDLLMDSVAGILRPALGRQIEIRAWLAGTSSTEAFQLRYRAHQAVGEAEALLSCSGPCGSPFEADTAAAAMLFRQADSMLVEASRIDRDWLEPILARGEIADRRAILAMRVSGGPADARPHLEAGIELAGRVLRREPDLAAALALRGRLRWHMRAWGIASGDSALRLLDEAEADLRAALRTNPGSPAAAAGLSEILYMERHEYREALSLASRAYATDAFMEDANIVINRAAMSALEMGDDTEAAEWCHEGIRRFPGQNHHLSCLIEVMAWGDGPANADSAWLLLEEATRNTPADYSQRVFAVNSLTVAAVLARLGLADSALAVIDATLDRARASFPSVAFLSQYEAAARFRAGDLAGGRRAFAEFHQAMPDFARVQARTRKLRNWVTLPAAR